MNVRRALFVQHGLIVFRRRDRAGRPIGGLARLAATARALRSPRTAARFRAAFRRALQSRVAQNEELLLARLPFLLEGRKRIVEALRFYLIDVHDGAVSVGPASAFEHSVGKLFDEQRGGEASILQMHVVLFAADEPASDVVRGISQDDDRVVSELARSFERMGHERLRVSPTLAAGGISRAVRT